MAGEKIGDRIKVLRREAGLSRADLSATCWISVEGIRLIEANRRIPRAKTLAHMAKALDTCSSDLFKLIEETTPVAPIRAINDKALGHLICNLRASERERVRGYIKAIIENRKD